MGYQTKISNLKTKTKQLYKTTSLFAIALVLSVTSITALIIPQANATTLPNVVADPGFDIGSGFNGNITSTAIQPDGKILVGGNFTTYNGTIQNRLVRLNADGSKDNSFDIGSGFDGTVRITPQLPDGKVLVGGNFTTYNGATQNRLVRLNADGSKDNSFDIGSGFYIDSVSTGMSTLVHTIELQPDGKVLVGGQFTSYNDSTQNFLIRLLSNGSKDTSFDMGSGFNGAVVKTILQPDGKIIVIGGFTSHDGSTENRLVRLNSDGSNDTSFDIGSGFDSQTRTILTQPDGKMLIGGFFTTYQGATHNRLIRLQITTDRDADGLLDTQEDSSPNSGDANQDGTLDSLQNNVTSYINPITNQTTVLEVDSQCSLSNISTKDMSTNTTQDTNYSYPLGLYDFTASCVTPGYTTTFKAYYYNADTTKTYSLRKYNPNTNTYTTIDNASFNIETIDNQSVLTASYTITDGSSLDTDGLVNGSIVDPAGPALASTVITSTNNTNNTNTPTAPNTGVAMNSSKQDLIALFISLNITIIAIVYIYRNRIRQYDEC